MTLVKPKTIGDYPASYDTGEQAADKIDLLFDAHESIAASAATLRTQHNSLAASAATLRTQHNSLAASAATLRTQHNSLAASAATLRTNHNSLAASAASRMFYLTDYGGGSTVTGTVNTTALHNAIAAIGATGGTLTLPRGTVRLNTSATLPVSLTGRLRILGSGTILKPKVACFLHTGASQTCRRVELGNFDIDGSDATGKQAMIGSFYNNTDGNKTHWDDIYIHDINMTGLKVDPSLATNHIYGIGLTAYHSVSGYPNATNIKNIVIERVNVEGGNAGCLVSGMASSGTTPNINIDNVTIRDFRHIIPAVQATFFASSGIQIGGYARVNRALIENCYSENPGDNGFEANNVQEFSFVKCSAKNPNSVGFTLNNFRAPTDIERQRYTLRDCAVLNTTATVNPTGVTFGSVPYGEIYIDGFNYSSTQAVSAINFDVSETACSVKRFVLKNALLDYGLSQTITGAEYPAGVNVFEFGSNNRHLIENVRIAVTGTVTGAYDFEWRGIQLGGTNTNFIVRDCTQTYAAASTAGTKSFLAIGECVGSHTGVYADGCRSTTTTNPVTGTSVNALNHVTGTNPHTWGNNWI